MYSSYEKRLIKLLVSYTIYPEKIIAPIAPKTAEDVDPSGKNTYIPRQHLKSQINSASVFTCGKLNFYIEKTLEEWTIKEHA